MRTSLSGARAATATLAALLLGSLLLSACGGKPPVADASHEADQRHCGSHADCASGYCASNGRCG